MTHSIRSTARVGMMLPLFSLGIVRVGAGQQPPPPPPNGRPNPVIPQSTVPGKTMPTLTMAGTGPATVTVTGLTSRSITLAWSAVPNAIAYWIHRQDVPGGPFIRGNQSTTALAQTDGGLLPGTAYQFKVSAVFPSSANRAEGFSAAIAATTSPPVAPSGLAAVLGQGKRSVTLSWTPLSDASSYRIVRDGTKIAEVTANSLGRVTRLPSTFTDFFPPAAVHSYQVQAVYRAIDPNGKPVEVASAAAPNPGVVFRALQSHTAWLSKPAGTGSLAESDAYYRSIGAIPDKDSFDKWKAANGFGGPSEVKVIYYNAADLDLGRDNHCAQTATSVACYQSNHGPQADSSDFPNSDAALRSAVAGAAPFASVAMEYSSGIVRDSRFKVSGPDVDTQLEVLPGDSVVITASGEIGMTGPDGVSYGCVRGQPLPCAASAALLAKLDGSYLVAGSRFATVYSGADPVTLHLAANLTSGSPAEGFYVARVRIVGYRVKFFVYGANGALLKQARLDTEGPKAVPQTCIACHGGTYRSGAEAGGTAFATISNASFLPFDVFKFKYSTDRGFTYADQQDNFRRINAMVLATKPNAGNPNNPIYNYLNTLYHGRIGNPGSAAFDDYVPSGWSGHADLYNKVVKQYCRTCHLTLGLAYDFMSYQAFVARKAAIQADLCANHSMPHNEVAFTHFWQQPGLMDYLADPNVLGIKCAP